MVRFNIIPYPLTTSDVSRNHKCTELEHNEFQSKNYGEKFL